MTLAPPGPARRAHQFGDMTGDLIQQARQFHLVVVRQPTDGLLDVVLERRPVLHLLPPALGRQEYPGHPLIVGVGLTPHCARLLQPLQDAGDPWARQMQGVRKLALADPVGAGKQAKAYQLAVVGLRVAQPSLHRLTVKVEHPSQRVEGLESRRSRFSAPGGGGKGGSPG